ncbi:MAG: flagellar basal body P-ring formation protein FlgA [Pseudomonadota bacterium]|jgi:flagella basal body P-ring formation protein FlgA
MRRLSLPCLLLLSAPLFAADTQVAPGEILAAAETHALRQASQPGLQVQVSAGPLDPRTHLPACSQPLEAYSAPGARPWGKTTVGVRCSAPVRWSLFVPVQVRVSGSYLSAARPLAPGQVLGADDVLTQFGELSALPQGLLNDPGQAVGKTLKSNLATGQPLRSEQLQAAWAIQAGQSVRLISRGPGFSVSNEGKAIGNAVEGQNVQVRTSNGQIVSGTARNGGIVEINL